MLLLIDGYGHLPPRRARRPAWVWIAVSLVLPGTVRSAATFEGLTNEWALNIHTACHTCPAIAPDGTIYFGTFTGRLWAVQPDGTRKWLFRAGLEIRSSPALGADGIIYFGSRDRKCYAVRPDGKKKWEFLTGAWVDSSPALAADGAICFGSWDKIFYCVGPDGTLRWRFSAAGPIVSSPAIDADGTIYFGSHDNKFYALAPDGKKKWEYATGGPIISSPALKPAEAVYFTSVDGCCYSLNLDGSLRWRLRTGGVTESSPVVAPGGTMYLGVNQQLWSITEAGDKKWERAVDGTIDTAPLVLSDSSICFISSWGHLLNLGSERQVNWSGGGLGSGFLAVAPPGVLYAFDFVQLLALRAPAPLAHSFWPKFRCNARNTGNVKDLQE